MAKYHILCFCFLQYEFLVSIGIRLVLLVHNCIISTVLDLVIMKTIMCQHFVFSLKHFYFSHYITHMSCYKMGETFSANCMKLFLN